MLDPVSARRRMVERQIARRGIRNPLVLGAMREVPREAFVPRDLAEFAYEDSPLPIEDGQTISQPFIVAQMIALAEIGPGDRVLEVGTGSGYAAAVMAEIAERVYTIERHPGLAASARRRLAQAGYDNVEVRAGDGTLGWPEAAPFDAIVAAAGGPEIPPSWREQLAIEGRLVMPVGMASSGQRLVKVTRRSHDDFEELDCGAVLFVPLIGAQGWEEDGRRPTAGREAAPSPAASSPAASPSREPTLPELIRAAAEPLPDPEDPAFGRLFDRYGDRRIVLLGEASHGTAEFYRARAAISRRLIQDHGFNIVAVEADWPDAAMVDRYVRHRPAQPGSEPPFRRFPTWMWRNEQFEAFVEWLRAHNERLEPAARTGFFGLDMYNLSASIAAVLGYLDRVDPGAASIARERYGCLTPWQKDPAVYGRIARSRRYAACEQEVVAQLKDLLEKRGEYARHDGELFLDAAQNARLVAAAERYYRVMYYGSSESWNLRDRHMFDTLNRLLEAGGADAKAIVWAHNSHIGDAAFTEMGVVREELNIGQLCREGFGDSAVLIGFGTHGGRVAAATDWDGPLEVMTVRPSRDGSYERLCHESGVGRFLLDLAEQAHPELRFALLQPRLERFIGVIYRPESELQSHYQEASLPQQFDAFVWFDETEAVTPLPGIQRPGAPETYPFGL